MHTILGSVTCVHISTLKSALVRSTSKLAKCELVKIFRKNKAPKIWPLSF